MYFGCWAGVTYLRYTVVTSPNKDETAVHCYDPALSVLVMLVSRNVFHAVSAYLAVNCLFYSRGEGGSTCKGKISAQIIPWCVLDFSSDMFLTQSSLGKTMICCVPNVYNPGYAYWV